MDNVNQRYGKKLTLKPCCLNKDDLFTLTAIIQESFTKAEIERYFYISTTIGETRVFVNSPEGFSQQTGLPEKINDLAFWIVSWDHKGRFDKSILLDFSRYSIQLNVEGLDLAWVNDKYIRIVNFLKTKTAWYWPLVTLERFIIFIITLILISSLIISIEIKEVSYYLNEITLVGIWIFLVFYDTRKIWPYANVRLDKDNLIFNKENLVAATLILILIAAFMVGTVLPLLKSW